MCLTSGMAAGARHIGMVASLAGHFKPDVIDSIVARIIAAYVRRL